MRRIKDKDKDRLFYLTVSINTKKFPFKTTKTIRELEKKGIHSCL